MAKYCRSLGSLMAGIGILEALFVLWKGSFLLFLISLASVFLNTFIYFAAGELNDRLEALESKNVSQPQGINIKDTDMQSYIYNTMADRKLMDQGGWRCTKCGRTNAVYVGTCACGASKH